MTINSNAKGKAGEREMAAFLRARGYGDARRGQQYSGGHDSPDVVGLPGVHIEVKRTESLSAYVALDQSIRDAGAANTPVVFHRKSRREWIAILRLEDFLSLYKRAA